MLLMARGMICSFVDSCSGATEAVSVSSFTRISSSVDFYARLITSGLIIL